MAVDKVSVSLERGLAAEVRAAAAAAGEPLSSWLAGAAARRLRAEALRAYLDEWEAEHGAFSAEELARASEDLRLPAAVERSA